MMATSSGTSLNEGESPATHQHLHLTVADERIQQKTQIHHTAYLRFRGVLLRMGSEVHFFCGE